MVLRDEVFAMLKVWSEHADAYNLLLPCMYLYVISIQLVTSILRKPELRDPTYLVPLHLATMNHV